ncbi:MAG TPA: mechanosensitive ion channel domain-containing protein [Thermoplasmata archaeon]|jgi:small-conductance mechanosensitive channel|nr:mechanosensitive ion channel domain-containing protein [Thermoplasmata archaeon]
MGLSEFADQIWENLRSNLLDGIPETFLMIVGGLIFLLVAILIIKVIRRVLSMFIKRTPIDKKVGDILVKSIYGLMLFVIIVAFLEMIGLSQIALALGATIAFMALAIGLAMNNVLGDFVAGGFLLGEKDFGPGFVVEAAGIKGTVIDVDMRKTRIKAEDGILHVVPNKAVEGAIWKVLERPAKK